MTKTDIESRAQKVFSLIQSFWPVPEDAPANPSDAVRSARTVADSFYELTTGTGLSLDQAACWLACATESNELVTLKMLPAELPPVSDLEFARTIIRRSAQPIGIIIALMDRERKTFMARSVAFKNDDRSLKLLSTFHEMTDAGLAERDLSTVN